MATLTKLTRCGITRFMLCGVLTLLATVANGQTSGTITGRVDDPSGGAVPNASISIINLGTGVQRSVTTNDSGLYAAYDLIVGQYNISVTTPGFKSISKEGIQLNVGDKLAINFDLSVGSETESVTVTGATPLINTETADISNTITTKQLTDLPVNGRAFTQIQQLIPGASRTMGDQGGTGFNSSRGFAINGQQEYATGFQVDGVENTDMGNGTGLLTSPGLESIGEMKITTTDYSAEYGNAAGATLLVVTRTGTDKFHGAAYEYFKNDALDARNYFSLSNQKLRFNDFGYRVGGPVFFPKLYPKARSKTFFFFAEEWRRNNTTDIFRAATPTLAMRNGDFSEEAARTGKHIVDPTTGQPFANDQIPATRLNQNALLLLQNNFPLPTPGQTGFLNFNENAPDTDNWRQETLNVTHQLTSGIQLQVRYIQDTETHHLSGVLWSNQSFPNIETTTFLPGHSFLGKVAQTIGNNMLNEVTYDYASNYGSKDKGAVTLQGNYLAPSGLTIKPIYDQPGTTKLPNLSFSGGWGQIDSSYYPWWAHHNVQEVIDNFSVIVGRHSFKVGGLYQHSVTPVGSQINPGIQGGFTFSGYASQDPMADFLLGDFASYSQLQTSLTPSYNYNQMELYAQDTWKITPRLTLNLGLRYFYIPHLYEANNLLYNFVPSAYDSTKAVSVNADGTIVPNSGDRYNGLISPVTGLPTDLVKNQPWKFGPRIGVAFDPTGRGQTSIRAGYGIGYYRVQGNDSYSLVGNPPNGNIGVVFNGPLDNPGAGIAGALTPFGVTAIDQHYPSPSVQSWSLDVQRQLSSTTEADLAYVGTHGTHSDTVRNINQPLPGDGYDFNPGLNTGDVILSTIVPYRGFTTINTHVPGGSTSYSGLQAHLRKQVSYGLFAEVSYTWSKTISDAPGFNYALQNSYDIQAERSLASYDRRHMLVANYNYELPFFRQRRGMMGSLLGGWQTSGIVNLQAGTPLTVNLGTATNGLATRPNLKPGAQEHTAKTTTQWFDPNVYEQPAAGFFGTLKPFSVRGPGFATWDTAIFKAFSLKEQMRFLLRIDAFNVLNHPSWSGVNQSFAGNDASGNAVQNGIGQVVSAHDPRILQISGKFDF